MRQTSRTVRRTYYVLSAGNTLAASLIWGINTIFLLDAGLTNFEAFAANACFTAGMVLFEIPTGVVADRWGRRASFLCGTLTLAQRPQVSTCCSGSCAQQFVLVGDRFRAPRTRIHLLLWCNRGLAGRRADRDQVRGPARGRFRPRPGDLRCDDAGRLGGRWLSRPAHQPRRAVRGPGRNSDRDVLLALFMMRDLGFTPDRGDRPLAEMKKILNSSVEHGLKVPAVRAIMLAGMFSGGVGIYVYYALQPHLLNLWGNQKAYGIAGLVAALVAGAQIVGGLLTPWIRSAFKRRTSALLILGRLGVAMLALIGLTANFWVVIVLIMLWGLVAFAGGPIRQAYLNGMIPSQQRATILSFDSLINSAGGIVAQPVLGKSADVWGYQVSYLLSAAGSALALPFIARARQLNTPADHETAPPPQTKASSAEEIDA